ncbi:hemerythrin domain-containing protein [Marinobacterium arenosum]|uniref:hemerythrin domain-containing protein n=1 Tax=Marinobacterium arenosum TaxID=2862496 RepID=UPI001C93933A|nr:hemerythrin domain-containing protein [Marinobacterium arenosum]MBY4674976.1 hemerythrin domain-containing protein [Marinobacterium arenosum]
MTTKPDNSAAGCPDNPLTDFSNCHSGIIDNFERLRELAGSVIEDPVQAEIRQLADKLYNFFHRVVLEHHAEEEQELFTEVADSARNGADGKAAKAMIKQLTNEHRQLETLWRLIEPDIRQLAKGKRVELDRVTAMKLANEYLAHARFEEEQFLPLSAKLLGERGLASLGLSLHMRHAEVSIPNYI